MNEARAAALLAMLAEDPHDAFALYGLAMEHRAGDDPAAAEPLLRRLLVVEPTHLYGHYQLGSVLLDLDRADEAAVILDAGLDAARAAGDAKAAGEILALRDTCD